MGSIGIDIVIILKNGEEQNIEKLKSSIKLQKTYCTHRFLVYGGNCDNYDIFKEMGTNVQYINATGRLQQDYEELVKNLKSDYYVVLEEGEEWIDENFLQTAVEYMEAESQFGIYGMNAYDRTVNMNAYNCHEINCEVLYDIEYDKFVNYGIEDFYFYLGMSGKAEVFIIPPFMVYRNYKNYEGIFEKQKDIVIRSLPLKDFLFFSNLKYGMSVLELEIAGNVEGYRKVFWKTHLEYAIMVYAIQEIYREKNPHYTHFYVNHEIFMFRDKVHKAVKEGYILSSLEQQQIQFVLEEGWLDLPTGSQLSIHSYGERNPDKIFLVLGFEKRAHGLLAVVHNILCGIKYAEDNGLIPVIDLKNHFVRSLQSTRNKNKENAWEYYFLQLADGVTLDEVYESKNVMYMEEYEWCMPATYDIYSWSSEMYNTWSQLLYRNLHFSDEVQAYIDTMYDKLLSDKKNILGVSVRAGFFRLKESGNNIVMGHPIQVGLNTMIELVKKCFEEWRCEWIFLAIDDDDWKKEFEKIFGEKCICMNRKRCICFDKGKVVSGERYYKNALSKNVVKDNIEYLCETYLLSRCDFLLASKCGCSRMAYLWNGNTYENVYIVDEGKY